MNTSTSSAGDDPVRPSAALQLDVQGFGIAYLGQAPLAEHWSSAVGPGLTLVYGDTGSGKSTIVRALAGLESFDGRLVISRGATAVTLTGKSSTEERAAWSRHVFFCDAYTDAYDQVKMREATAALNVGSDSSGGFDEALWNELVVGFSLVPHIDKPLYMLSTGSKRKVWLAAALASGRPLMLLDEPTAALDAPSIRCMWSALAKQSDRIVIVASADREVGAPLRATVELPIRAA